MSIEQHLRKVNPQFAHSFLHRQRPKLWPWLFSALLLAGCAHRYDITLVNGERVTNVTKPILNRSEGVFYYKDVRGLEHHVFAGRVVDIGPHSSSHVPPGTIQQ
jgi:hypothetical protein